MEVLASLFLLLWHTWNIRNKIKHEEASVCIGSSVIFLNRYMHSLFTIRQQGDPLDNKGKRSLIPSMCKRKDPAANRVKNKWCTPPLGTFKINVDAAFNLQSGEAAIGVVIRDWVGDLKLTAWRVIFHCRDAEEAEARACLEGVHLAHRWPEVPMVLESDCHSVVTKLNESTRDRSLIWQLIEEAREVGGQLSRIQFDQISRTQNNLAHLLAQFAIRSRECQVFFSCFPEWIATLSCKDIA
jgi:ribonuclease HI